MGLAASHGASSGAAERRVPPRRSDVIQPKVIAGDTWLKPTDTVSPTLLSFIRKKKRYRLRDDFEGNLTAEPVHLMDMSKKYLLGETHGDAATDKWARRSNSGPRSARCSNRPRRCRARSAARSECRPPIRRISRWRTATPVR